jgi:hypothetical protein
MKNKYYTPEIEEFHVGFEYERNQYNNNIWFKYVVERKDVLDHSDKDIRVKYLDREDIESAGFKHIGAGWFESKELDCRIRKWKGLEVDIYKNWSDIYLADQDELRCFTGSIKNLSEFKLILKQLNIN